MSAAKPLCLSEQVINRLRECLSHIENMSIERQGYGRDALVEVHATRASFLKGLGMLLAAEELWPDGPAPSLSLNGVMPGGLVFGMIAHERQDDRFKFKEIEWTFHS